MKKFFNALIVAAMLSVLSTGCTKDRETISKNVNVQGNIKGIVIDGSWQVNVFQDDNCSATIDYSAFLEGKIVAEVRSDGYLYLKCSKNGNIRRDDLVATVSLTNLELIDMSSAAEITLNGNYLGDKLKINMENASEIKKLNYTGNSVEIGISDAARCTISGEVQSASISGSGASSFYMLNTSTSDLNINLSSASNAEITINGIVTGKLKSASTLKYQGIADVSSLKLEGGSKVKKL